MTMRRRPIALALLVGCNIPIAVTDWVLTNRDQAHAQDSRPAQSSKPREHRMDLGAFWKIIEDARSDSHDDEDFLGRVGTRLDTLKPEELLGFDLHFKKMLARSYSWDLWGAAWLIVDGCADDCFHYFRAWLISQGPETFKKALEDPDALASLVAPERGTVRAFEAFLQMPGDAYEEKTGEDILDSPYYEIIRLPRLGERWDFGNATEMRKRYPKLFAKHAGR